MNKLLGGVLAAGLAMVAGAAFAQDKPLLGIVSITRHRSQQCALHPGRDEGAPRSSAGRSR